VDPIRWTGGGVLTEVSVPKMKPTDNYRVDQTARTLKAFSDGDLDQGASGHTISGPIYGHHFLVATDEEENKGGQKLTRGPMKRRGEARRLAKTVWSSAPSISGIFRCAIRISDRVSRFGPVAGYTDRADAGVQEREIRAIAGPASAIVGHVVGSGEIPWFEGHIRFLRLL